MSAPTRLGPNTLWLLAARLGAQALTVAFTLMLTRRLGEAVFGEYAFVASLGFVANTLTTFGTDMLLIREIAYGRGLARLTPALGLQLVLSSILAVLLFAAAPHLPNSTPDVTLGLRLASLALFPLAFYTVFTSVLRGSERMDWYAILGLVVALLQVAGVALFLRTGAGAGMVMGIVLAAQVAGTLVAAAVCARLFPEVRDAWRAPRREAWLETVHASAPIALLGLLGMAYQRLGVVLLFALSGAAVTGWFSAAARTVEAGKVAHLAVFGALYPVLARSHASPEAGARLSGGIRASLVSLLALAAAGSLGLYAFAPPLVRLLFGDAFDASVLPLQILAWMLVPYTLNTHWSLDLLAGGREGRVAIALLVGLVSLAILSAWWIPRVGLTGAAWATLAAEAIQSAALFVLRIKPLDLQRPTATPDAARRTSP